MAKALVKGNKEVDVLRKDDRAIISIIKKGIALKSRLETIKQEIQGNNDRLLPFAEELSETTGMKNAVFKSVDGKVTVKFSDSINYNEKAMGTIREILGPQFGRLFTRETSYILNIEDIPEVKKRLGKNFEHLVREESVHKHTKLIRDFLSDGDDETSKELRKFVSIEPRKPAVNFESYSAFIKTSADKNATARKKG